MPQHPLRLTVLMPLRDDWRSAAELIRRVDQVISSDVGAVEILLVDDGSAQRCDHSDFQNEFTVVRAIRTLRLRRHLGHQRAIAIGLVHVHQNLNFDSGIAGSAQFREFSPGCSYIQSAKRSSKFGGLRPFQMAAEAAASRSSARGCRTGLNAPIGLFRPEPFKAPARTTPFSRQLTLVVGYQPWKSLFGVWQHAA